MKFTCTNSTIHVQKNAQIDMQCLNLVLASRCIHMNKYTINNIIFFTYQHFLKFYKTYIQDEVVVLLISLVPTSKRSGRYSVHEEKQVSLTSLIATCSLLYKFFPTNRKELRNGRERRKGGREKRKREREKEE